MNDIQQIRVIADSLTKEKEKYMNELMKLNSLLNNKQAMLDKMQSYQNDYLNGGNLVLSKSIPGLNNNIGQFVKKIDTVINQAQFEINTMLQIRSSLLEKIDKINKKIDLMNMFEERLKTEMIVKNEKREQNFLDEISATVLSGGEHE